MSKVFCGKCRYYRKSFLFKFTLHFPDRCECPLNAKCVSTYKEKDSYYISTPKELNKNNDCSFCKKKTIISSIVTFVKETPREIIIGFAFALIFPTVFVAICN
jgi:hypothetical protein